MSAHKPRTIIELGVIMRFEVDGEVPTSKQLGLAIAEKIGGVIASEDIGKPGKWVLITKEMTFTSVEIEK